MRRCLKPGWVPREQESDQVHLRSSFYQGLRSEIHVLLDSVANCKLPPVQLESTIYVTMYTNVCQKAHPPLLDIRRGYKWTVDTILDCSSTSRTSSCPRAQERIGRTVCVVVTGYPPSENGRQGQTGGFVLRYDSTKFCLFCQFVAAHDC